MFFAITEVIFRGSLYPDPAKTAAATVLETHSTTGGSNPRTQSTHTVCWQQVGKRARRRHAPVASPAANPAAPTEIRYKV